MKARIFYVEVEDLSASELGDVVARVFDGVTWPKGPTLPAPAPAPAILPEPAATGPSPLPHTRMQLAKVPKTWRPGRGTRREDPSPKQLRPTTAEKTICGDCGTDKPAGMGNFKCPKCNGRNWEKIPARAPIPEAVDDSDDE